MATQGLPSRLLAGFLLLQSLLGLSSSLQPDASATPHIVGEGKEPLPYVGEIRWITFNYPPEGWAIAHGQSVEMKRFRSLLSVIGDEYGHYGKYETFVLPNLLDPRLNDTSAMSEDELQQLITADKEWELLPIIALSGVLPTDTLFPVIKSDREFTVEERRLDRISIDDEPPPAPPRFDETNVEIKSRQGMAAAASQEANRAKGLAERGPYRAVDPKA